jgi:hypothetical protein
MKRKCCMPFPLVLVALILLLTVPWPAGSSNMRVLGSSIQVRPGTSPFVEIPFTIVDDHIVVPVSVNDSPEIDMLLDTGLPIKGAMLLDSSLAEKLALDYSGTTDFGGGGNGGTRTADISKGANFSFSGFGFPGQQVFVPRETGFADDWPAAAILGITFFDHPVEIDFSRSMIRLYKAVDDLPEDPGYELDLTFTMGIPVVEAQVAVEDGRLLPVSLIADTGVNAPLLLFPHSDDEIDVPPGAIETSSGVLSEGLTGDVCGKIGRVAEFRIGPYVFRDVVTAFPTQPSMGHANMLGQNGFVGTATFRRFTVVFDYPNSRVYLKPNDRYGERFEWNMAGLLMGINREGFLQVKDVVEGSPGDKQGIRPDDVIVGADYRDLRDLDSEAIHRLFNEEGARLHLTVRRGSDRLEVTLTLKRLI